MNKMLIRTTLKDVLFCSKVVKDDIHKMWTIVNHRHWLCPPVLLLVHDGKVNEANTYKSHAVIEIIMSVIKT